MTIGQRVLNDDALTWCAAGVIALVAFAFVYARGPDENYDLLNYHYYAGYALLSGRFDWDIAAAGVQTFFNPLPSLLPYLAYRLLEFPANAFVITAVQLLSLPIVVQLCRETACQPSRIAVRGAPAIALLLAFASPIWWSELGTSFSSATTAPLVLLGLLCALRGAGKGTADSRSIRRFALSGAVLGLATGLRLTNVPFALALPSTLLPLALERRWGVVLKLAASYSGGALLGFGALAWWNVSLFNSWRNPFFPLWNGIFKSPWFDQVDFRDLRWRFDSVHEFMSYLFSMAAGTDKTLELSFADTRWSMVAVFAVVGATGFVLDLWRRGRSALLNASPIDTGLLAFFALSLTLWAVGFAYQRYVIPIELVCGIVLWVLASAVIRHRMQTAALVGFLVLAWYGLRIPDWGHNSLASSKAAARFGLDIPQTLRDRPQLFLVFGQANSYLFPFLHPDSRFVRADFTHRIDVKVVDAMRANPTLPVAVLANEDAIEDGLEAANRLGAIPPGVERWSCPRFRSFVGVYAACTWQSSGTDNNAMEENFAIDFRDGALYPPYVISVTGLSRAEKWGRWSDGKVVSVRFASCLPDGPLEVLLTANAFGPNVESAIVVRAGDNAARFRLSAHTADVSVVVPHDSSCQASLAFEVPNPVSPKALGQSSDPRPLGIGFTHLRVTPVRARNEQVSR
jgi:hypothetical protein